MTSIVEECAQHCLLADGQTTLYDSLPPFDEDLAGDVTAEELSLPSAAETVDDSQGPSGSSLPATPAERPCTFCPSSLPLPPATCPARATLVLDLDGTLIASEELNSSNSAYLWNTPAGARAPDYEAMGRRVWLRPGVREFLAAVRPHFEIVLFTAATQNWAAAAVEQLDPLAELFDVMLHRDHTTSDLMWDYVKDLSRLGRDLARVVIVDDNPLMFMYQPDNALHIGAYEAVIAGGPDNVLPRVAEVLINQVAPANDVRDVLGPMASSKSCISSTISATATAPIVAAAPHTQLQAEMAAVAAGGMGSDVSASGSRHGDQPMADVADPTFGGRSCMAAASGLADDVFTDEQCLFGGCEGAKIQQQKQNQKIEGEEQQQQQQDLPQAQQGHREGSHCRTGLCMEGESSGSLIARDADKDVDWEGDSEGAETFDEHGAAAQLGAVVDGSCHRHRAWDEAHCSPGGGDDAAAVGAPTPTATQVLQSGEQGGSDACQSEEHSVHSSEVFEALMDDAMAEYDSDSYESPFASGTGYDYACPVAIAAPASALTGSSAIPDKPPCIGGYSNDGRCRKLGHPSSCSLTPCACGRASATGDEGGPPIDVERKLPCCDGSAGVPTSSDADVGRSGAGPTCSNGEASVAGQAAASVVGPTTLQVPAGHDAEVSPCPTFEDVQLWQTPLPTGMVFLTDLNPAFGPCCASSDAALSAAAVGGCDVAAPDVLEVSTWPDVLGPTELLGCKRVRVESDRAGDGFGGVRDVVARLACDGTARRLRLAGCDLHAAKVAAADGSTAALTDATAAPVPCASS